jgi:hypothetical protein
MLAVKPTHMRELKWLSCLSCREHSLFSDQSRIALIRSLYDVTPLKALNGVDGIECNHHTSSNTGESNYFLCVHCAASGALVRLYPSPPLLLGAPGGWYHSYGVWERPKRLSVQFISTSNVHAHTHARAFNICGLC